MGARALTQDVHAVWRMDGWAVIILVLDAESADARDCFHALFTGVKGAGRRSGGVYSIVYRANWVRACRLRRRGDAFAEQCGGDKQHGQDWQAHRNLPKFVELLKSYPMQLSRLTRETMALPMRRSRNATMRPALACRRGRCQPRPHAASAPLAGAPQRGRGHRCDSDSHAQTRHARQEAAGVIG
jgi:hypothetical protein